ncbi:MAG TPA: hypothetical protein VFX28_25670, partial [Methylomirabilota bacterium]|nr:hypothetical protein [Methylomirabilota bacterium]
MTERLARALEDARRRWVPDRRLGVFDVALKFADEPDAPRRMLTGVTTSRDALAGLRRLAAEAGLRDDVRLLPDASVGGDTAAIVKMPLA